MALWGVYARGSMVRGVASNGPLPSRRSLRSAPEASKSSDTKPLLTENGAAAVTAAGAADVGTAAATAAGLALVGRSTKEVSDMADRVASK